MSNEAWFAIGLVLYVLIGFFVGGITLDEGDQAGLGAAVLGWPFLLMMCLGDWVRGLLERRGR